MPLLDRQTSPCAVVGQASVTVCRRWTGKRHRVPSLDRQGLMMFGPRSYVGCTLDSLGDAEAVSVHAATGLAVYEVLFHLNVDLCCNYPLSHCSNSRIQFTRSTNLKISCRGLQLKATRLDNAEKT